MHEHYAYTRFRIAPRAWREVTPRIAEQGARQVENAGGSLFGVFAGQIGLGANEGVALTAWPDRQTLEKSGGSLVQGVEGVVESSSEPFVATVRPVDPTPTRPRRAIPACSHTARSSCASPTGRSSWRCPTARGRASNARTARASSASFAAST